MVTRESSGTSPNGREVLGEIEVFGKLGMPTPNTTRLLVVIGMLGLLTPSWRRLLELLRSLEWLRLLEPTEISKVLGSRNLLECGVSSSIGGSIVSPTSL